MAWVPPGLIPRLMDAGRTRIEALIGSIHRRIRFPLLDLTDFKRDLSELTDRLGHAQDCL